MTPYEMLDLGQSSYSTSVAYVSIFITLLSAYLVAAYIVAGRLSKAQFLLANSLYLVIQTLTILTIYNFNSSARFWGNLGRSNMPVSSESANVTYIPEAVALVLILTMLLSVWFMWKSWNPKAE
ncbi:hypothetical protein LCGC14_0024030 [marine sediment metagenome]|uniref:Uncharacterized protein n=1 Tax=marine sediment metagenome TaxID=412755 RepID=A0A0F9W3J1_9ZZZZ